MSTKQGFEIVDLGVDSPDYFQGFGTSFTPYEHCVVGIGDTASEAYQDALESVAQFEDSARIMELLPDSCGIDNGVDHSDDDPDDDGEAPTFWYHIGIRWT